MEFLGVVRGNTIELERDPGLPDNQHVVVVVRPIEPAALSPDDGLRSSFGAWSEDADALDKFLAELRAARKKPRPPVD